MDGVPEDDILQPSICVIKILGEYFNYSSVRLTTFRLWNCFVFSLNILISLNSLFYVKAEMYVKSLEGATTASHTLVNYLCFLYYKRDIELLFDDLKRFWDYKNLPSARLSYNIIQQHIDFNIYVILVGSKSHTEEVIASYDDQSTAARVHVYRRYNEHESRHLWSGDPEDVFILRGIKKCA
ncbi:hypothetical protein Trydic_g17467 [Trypoxylus dichotomus]